MFSVLGNENNTCVAMKTRQTSGLWVNSPCTKTMPYICELPRKGYTTPIPTTTTTVKLACPTGWGSWANSCYKVIQ